MDARTQNSVLVVDDDMSSRRDLAHILQSDYTVYTAQDGPSALEKAEQHVPDLILLDVRMPGMDGFAVLAALQESDRLAGIPVIFITGLNRSDAEEKGLALGAMDYITKPFRPTIVKLRVRHQIEIINQLRTIKRLSMVDQLTAIPNRRSFDDRLHMEWARAIRENHPVSIMMIDVDRFKGYNDTYGHLQGDVALQTLAKILARQLERPGDFCARWGGEEFAALLPNTDIQGGLHIGEQIRAAVENAVVPCPDGSDTRVTVSVGVNVHVPALDSSVDALISGADKALYAAKEAGRNRVVLYDGAVAAPGWCPSTS